MEIFLAILFFSEKEKRRVYNVKSPPSVYLSSPSFLIVLLLPGPWSRRICLGISDALAPGDVDAGPAGAQASLS